MKVLIIGVKGFIGSHTYRYFSGFNDYDVYGCDVHTDYIQKKYFQLDITNSDFSKIFIVNKFDLCINCSGAASVPDSFKNPYRDYALNTFNVFKILDSIKEYNPECRFINLSSAAVYGNPASLPVKETHPSKPLSPYGYHKKQSEVICEEYANFYGVKCCSVRVFSAFGEGLKKQLFWDLYQKSIGDENIELWGTGNETRDFIYVKDLTRALWVVAEHALMQGECINVANGEEIAIKDSVALFYNILKVEKEYRFIGKERLGDPVCWKADISLLKGMGYEPKYSIEDGLKGYAEWLRELR